MGVLDASWSAAAVPEERLAGLGPLEMQVRVMLAGEADAAVALDVLPRDTGVHLRGVGLEQSFPQECHGDHVRSPASDVRADSAPRK
jgi:hypothetical protein